VAVSATFILHYPFIWAVLITAGITVAVLSLTARDHKSYWLAIFALALPFEIKKMLVDSGYAQEFVLNYGFPVGELPGPVLYLTDIVFVILLVLWFIEIKNGRQKIYFPKSNVIALAFLGWSALSLVNAVSFSSGFFEFLRMTKLYILFLYMANNINSKKTLKTLVTFFFIGVIFQGLLCMFQFLIQSKGFLLGGLFGKQGYFSQELMKKMNPFFSVAEAGSSRVRASGTAGASNAEAQYFEFLVPVAFVLWLTAKRFASNLFNLTVLTSGLVGLLFTFSRGGFIGMTAGLSTALILTWKTGLISNRKFVTFVIIALLIFTIIIPVTYSYLMTRPESTQARFYLNKVGLEMIKAHPVIGVGLNNHLVLKREYDPTNYVFPMPTHNHYILLASQIGIPGLIFFLGFMISILMSSLKAVQIKDLYSASIAAGIFCGIVAVAVHVMADYIGTYTNMTLLWLYGGLAAALSNRERYIFS
jgi:O-antigen ligase